MLKQKAVSISVPVMAALSSMIAPYFPVFSDPSKLLRLLQDGATKASDPSPAAAKLPQFLTIKQTAKQLNCCPRTIGNWIRDDKLQCVRMSRKGIVIPVSELERLTSQTEGRG